MNDSQNELETIAANCLCFNLRKTSRLASQVYDTYYRSIGLLGTQVFLLLIIQSRTGLSCGELGRVSGLRQSSVTRNLEVLASHGYVRSDPDPADARRKILSLTTSGKRKIDEAIPVWREAQQMLIDQLGGEKTALLLGMLKETADCLR